MNLSFNYYHHLEDVDFYLCNPDGEELFPINAYDRTVTLRFNDLSAVEFKVNPRIELIDGRVIDQTSCYDMLATMRLVFVSNIGWFRISSVSETDDGAERYKSVRAESLQTIFKDKGFSTVEGVYKFYDPFDPFDDNFTLGATKNDGTPYLPSIVGQLSRQLGIGVSIGQSGQSYSGWSITYISPELEYDSGSPICRTFSEKTTYGYDFMVNDVSKAFGVVFLFDFMNKTIQIKIAANATGASGVCFSFNNFMKSVDVEESIEDIVTVMSCNGSGIDITSVNPTGTNYIVDFSYYMNSGEWMSGSLVSALRDWESLVSAKQPEYVDSIKSLRSLYSEKVVAESNMSGWSVWLRDLKSSQDEYIVSLTSDTEIVGIATAESVDVEGHSLLSTSSFAESAFEANTMITAYESAPVYNKDDGVWAFDGAGVYASVADHFVANRIYFTDDSSSRSYCKLEGKTVVDASSGETQSVCTKFVRYIDYSTTSNWIVLYEQLVAESAQSVDGMEGQIQDLNDKLTEISDELNLVNYFSKTPELLRELACYWVEGDYSNENIALLDSMTTDEMIDLSYELMDAGSAELSMMSQPRYTFSLQANHVLSQYEFRSQMAALSLGCSVSVEKEDGAWYYPTLLEMSFSLDDHDTFNLVFANALRLDDWGYTYAELIAGASSTSRQVSSNWYDLTSYKREKDKLSQLIESPLDATLRASIANSVNQEFTVDNTGILGRKSIPGSPGRYEDEQLRMINNLLIFTEDGWETAKTALGKIYWIDPETQEEHIDYGLVAETIIGSLVMSERLKIVNADSSVHIGADGIQILDSDGSVVFHASADGSVTVKSYVSAAELKAFKVTASNIEAGSITSDLIASDAITADKINAGAITTGKIAAGAVKAEQIDSNAVTADKIKAGEIQSNHINAKAVTAEKIDVDAVTSEKIAAGAVKAVNIDAEAITAEKIKAGEIQAVHLDTASVTAEKIKSGAINTEKIEAGAVQSEQIDSDAITADKIKAGEINASHLAADSVTASKIKAGEINTEHIATDAITADKILANTITADKIKAGEITIGCLDGSVSGKINNSIASTIIEYALSDGAGAGNEPQTGWSVNPPERQDGKYLWQRTTITYNGETKPPTVTMACIQGADGKGVAIKGAAYVDIEVSDDIIGNSYELFSDSSLSDDSKITVVADGDAYLVKGYLFVYSGSGILFVCAGMIQGPAGKNGISVVGVVTRYYVSETNDKESAPDNTASDDNGWFTNFDSALDRYWQLKAKDTDKTYYIWSHDRVDYSFGEPTYSESVVNDASLSISMFCLENGITKIDGAHIATGTITAKHIGAGAITADKINTAGLRADNIHVTDTDGNTVFFADASSLPVIIGGFNVNNTSLFSGKTTYQDDNDGVYIGTDGVGLGKGKFYVTKEGKLTATDGSLSNLTLDGCLYFGGNKEYYINANHGNVDYYINLPGLIIDDGEAIFDGTITAREGELQDLTIGGRLSFGGNDSYYINTSGSGGDYYINLPNFTVNDSGAVFGGELSAPSGDIGGFEIEGACLSAASDDGEVYLGTDGIRLGDTFSVTNTGKLTATDADIYGTITAINGGIGGWNITQDGIMTDNVGLLSGDRYKYDSKVNSGTSLAKFYAGKKSSDKYTHTGLTYGDNRIDVYDNYRILRYDYQASLDVPDIGYFTASVEMTNSTFALCSEVQSIEYDYEENWVYIEIKTTYTGYDNPSETAINVTFEYNFDFNTKILEDGSFYAKAVDIEGNIKATSGTFSNCTIDDTCVINGSLAADVICSRSESDGAYDASAQIRYIGYSDIMNHMVVAGYQMRTDTLLGSAMIDTSCDTLGNPFAEMLVLGDNVCSSISASESGVVLESYSMVDNSYSTTLAVRATGGYLYGTWYGTSSEAIASDANAKNNISDMDDRYGVLFDHLQPKVYKYNDGTSNRLHSGFVAQEVDDALTAAGIDRSEFAAVCISNQGTATEQWSLRYDEFIALNVREIQKLKARVAELEAKLKERSI